MYTYVYSNTGNRIRNRIRIYIKKQLHYCDKFNKITSSNKSSTWGSKNIVPQSNFRQLPEMGLTVLLHWRRKSVVL